MEPYNTIKDYLDITPQDEVNNLIEFLLSGPPSWEEYVNNFQDLIDNGITNGCRHFIHDGWKEKRMSPLGYKLAPSTVIPSGWKPPTAPGLHEICTKSGPFFMSGLRVPEGILLGTYRPAKLYLYDGTFHEEFSGPYESVYMLHLTPTGPIFTTERPAGVWKKINGRWKNVLQRPEVDSLGFDVWPYKGGLVLYTASNVSRNSVRTYLGDINGENWRPYKDHSGFYMPQLCTDGQTYYLVGSKEGMPYVQHENGSQVIWMQDYKHQEINYASVKDGLFTFGLNNDQPQIQEDGTNRNGYVMYGRTNGMYHSGIDLQPPYIMQTDIFNGKRYAIASIWNEGGYPNPQFAQSDDGIAWPENKVITIPFPSVQTMDKGDDGIYFFGGKKDSFGKVCYLNLKV